jgi:tRNA dimethylallyltransferase
MQAAMHDVLVVVGPTASGKSALALALAERLGGTVINADAMQCYRDLRIITARPTPEEEAQAPHALYGVLDAATPATAAWWRDAALAAIEAARAAGRLPILCGGTGLYLRALAEGIADVPPIPPEARAEARRLLAADGPGALHARLMVLDPETAARLRPSDSQRLARAYEVAIGTGQGLAAWQRAKPAPPALRFTAILIDPPRQALATAIAARFDAMLAAGALDEVRALLARGLDPALPLLRAHGVPEFFDHLAGRVALAEAASRAVAATLRYTKRQRTWWRHHAPAPDGRVLPIHARIPAMTQFPESFSADIFAFLDCMGLTAAQHRP